MHSNLVHTQKPPDRRLKGAPLAQSRKSIISHTKMSKILKKNQRKTVIKENQFALWTWFMAWIILRKQVSTGMLVIQKMLNVISGFFSVCSSSLQPQCKDRLYRVLS